MAKCTKFPLKTKPSYISKNEIKPKILFFFKYEKKFLSKKKKFYFYNKLDFDFQTK